MSDSEKPALPDLASGVSITSLADGGFMKGRIGDDEVLLARSGGEVFAVGAHCTHYHGPLADGLIVGDTVRCPWHHACFSLRSGEALRAPALDPIGCWKVERQGEMAFVREKLPPPAVKTPATPFPPVSAIIIGGGAAGLVAADMLRRDGYQGPITMISADADPPADRPNLSKDYLAGNAQPDWIPLRGPEFYADERIELILGHRVVSIDIGAQKVRLDDGQQRIFGRLLIATGAEPVRLPITGAESERVHYLRSFADSRAIVEKAQTAKDVLVVGASFIGLEVAASLRARGIGVHVVAHDAVPLARVMGREIGTFVRSLHEQQGVVFHLGQTVKRMDGRTVTLSGGARVEADLVVVGIGVRPLIALAERAGLAIDRGIIVSEFLETSATGVFAAGDCARWIYARTGERIRVEHWVVAERMGQAAARNMLGRRESFDLVPFFWSQHYDVTINYVGYAEQWDSLEVDGSIEGRDGMVTFTRGERTVAVATIGRDLESLKAEAAMERDKRARQAPPRSE